MARVVPRRHFASRALIVDPRRAPLIAIMEVLEDGSGAPGSIPMSLSVEVSLIFHEVSQHGIRAPDSGRADFVGVTSSGGRARRSPPLEFLIERSEIAVRSRAAPS